MAGKRQYSLRELIHMDSGRRARETRERWRERIKRERDWLLEQVVTLEKRAGLDSLVLTPKTLESIGRIAALMPALGSELDALEKQVNSAAAGGK
jgi:hypothetical protein